MIDLSSNYFEIFSLPVDYQIDPNRLVETYRELQTSCHPDRFATEADSVRRQAVQTAAVVNEAYETLKDPLSRGLYLLSLSGVVLDEQATTSDTEFLMQQMEFRERLDAVAGLVDPFAGADALRSDLNIEIKHLFESFKSAYDAESLEDAQHALTKTRFFRRLGSQLDDIEARLEDEQL